MKKILLSLFISLCGLVSFSYGVSNCINPGDSANYSQNDSFTNCDYNYPLIVCVYGQNGAVEFPNYGPTYNLQNAPICTLLDFTDNIYVNARGSQYQVIVYDTMASSCDGSSFKLNFHDNNTLNNSQYTFNLSDGDYYNVYVNYNSLYDNFSLNGSDFDILPKTSTINAVSDYSTCSSSLNSCKTTLNNAICESHIQFQDISNGTGVKTLSSYFSPFSGANNNSVYYYSQENVVQIDSQYGVAQIFSDIPSVPPEPCDCSEAISGAVASCNSQLSSLSGNYNSCLSELNSCMAGGYNTGDLTWSALYINQIQHLGKPIIRINIPEEISRDYSNTGDSFDLDINGYNVDTEYVDNIIKIQNYKPTTEDFTKLVGLFGKYGGLLVSCLLVIIIFALIRKMFK